MASEIKVDTISEKTSAGGVTIDGLLIKDGGISGDVSLIGTTPTFTIGDAGAEDAALVFDGNAQDYYIALDDSADDLLIGLGSTVGTTPAISIDSDLKVNIPVTTASTSTSTGSLITGGGMGVGADLYIGDDTYLITDSAVLGFGADKDTTLTHTDGTGLTLNSTNKLCFNDASQFVQGSSATVISIGATDEIDLTATAVDLNGTLDVSGTSLLTGRVGVVTAGDLGEGLHVRVSDSGASVDSSFDTIVLEQSGNSGMSILSGNSNKGGIVFGDDGDVNKGKIEYFHNGDYMSFTANDTEVMRSDPPTTGGGAATNSFRVIHDDDTNNSVLINFQNNDDSTNESYLLQLRYNGKARDNNSTHYINGEDSAAARFNILSDGDITNHDNSYGAISDERIKQDIIDANSQWDDIKAVKVRNYKKKDDVRQYGVDNAWQQIGVIAQELEAVSPKLIKEGNPSKSDIESSSEFGTLYTEQDKTDGNIPEGKEVGFVKEIKTTVKKVSYSVLYMKAIKALQEAQTRIETLETEMTALKARVTTLEG
jgi:hypothetical protein